MADEVPASDVLCQAMDYLSKLGSNLRLRSENLKEKRISRDKLKNSHAVHKAASKVLLICELSKKSIDNVETGVRKVLGLLEKATVSPNTGGNTSINKSSPSRKSSVHFFDYNSRKLRLASKINVKHYLSAKVLVKRMPTSVQESHPVYIDCKLYRSRKRALKHKRFKSTGITSRRNSSVHKCESDLETGNKDLSTSTTNNDNNISKVTEPSNGKDSCVEVGNNSNLNEEVCPELEDVPLNHGIELRVENSIIQINSPDKNKVNDTIITINDSEIDTPVKESRKCSVDSDDAEKCKDQKNKSSHADLSKIVKKVNRSDATSDEDLSDKSHKTKISKEKSKSKVNEVKKRKYKHFVISDDNSSDDNTRKKKLTDNPLRKKVSCISSEDEKSSDSKKSTLHEPKSKKIKHRHALSSSDEHDEKKNDSDSKVKEDEANNKDKANNKNEVSNKDTANNEDDANSNDVTNNKDKSYTENKANSDDLANVKDENVLEVDNKPLIRCVNISKLLKPDILHKESSIIQDSKSLKLKHSKPKTHPLGKKMENNTEKQTNKKEVDEVDKTKDIKNTTDKVNDDEYWTQKRKEVKVFKSKMFSITITRLPDITINFLLLHNLTRVTQGNAIICEKYKDTNKSDDISKVKNALLNDSESDNEISLLSVVKAKRTKRNLNDSDCDRDTSDKRQYCQADKTNVKNDITKDVEPVSNREVPMNKDTPVTNKGNVLNEVNVSPTKIKNALLNDSDSDRNNECVIQEKIKNIHPNEKKYDSEKIKKALLTGSDSEKKEECVKISQDKECNENEFINKEFEELEKTVSGILNSAGLNDIDSDKNENEIENNTLKEIVDTTQDSREDQSTNVDQQTSNDTHEHHEDVSCGSPKGDVVKDLSSSYTEAVKSSLLNDSSDSMSDGVKEKELSVKKHAKESANAKKKLLNHSSSDHQNSDAESEYSEDSSDENNPKTIKRKCLRKRMRRSYPSSSSNEEHDANKKIKKQSGSSDSVQENTDKDDGSSSQADGTTDQQSKSSSRKMVRSKAKPSGSSGQSSDNQDNSDKDIDGLANLESLNKPSRRRRDSASTTATNNTQDTNSTTKKKSRLKAAAISEDILKAESSSDNISDNENNVHSDVEELPAVGLTGFNGDSIDHLAKDDLLGDTDSSGSPDKDKTEHSQNVDDTEDEDNVKSKRRKANAILSDSEAGSSRRKNRGGKLSDFEDSEDDSSEPVKKSAKRKKVKSDSDGSAASSDDGKKKRRRIKQIDDSDASGSDSETEGRNKHGRKNIRKVMGKNQLEEATKKAAREEKERIARIAERQKLYNNLEFDESGKPDEVVLEKVVLDFDPETKEPLIEVDRGLVKKLKPHQANGIKFMWDACFESVKRIKKDKGSGCILAHCMGLGKTLQVISLTHTLLIHASLTGVNRVLVVCPLSTVLNWVSEFRMWLKHAENDFEVEVYELSRYKQNSERAYQLQSWFECGGVCVLGYEMFRNLSADNSKKYKKKMLKSFQESLVDPGPDLVICDEGHLLKNEKTSLSQSMNRVKTRRRIVLTGTPLQNNLKEYYCMVQFVKPNLLGKYNEYLNRFVNPITNGQYTDSTEHDIKIMKRRSHVLHKMLDGAVQRRDYGVLAPFLPPKHEFVLFITLTEVQIKLYQHYLDNYSRRPQPGKSSGFLFPDFQSLQRIWTHPLVLKYNSERYEIMQQKKREREEEDDSEGSLADFINDDSTPDESTTEESTDDSSVASDDDNRKKTKKKKASKKGKGKATTRRGTRANPEIEDEHTVEEVVEVKNENPTEWWIKLVSDDDELDDMRNSHKLVLLFDILRQCEAIGDKLLVFSQSLYSLDLIEHFLGKVDEATQEGRVDEKLGGHVGSWSPGIDYFRLDGSTSCENRSIWCKNFNREDNPRARLFLISTRAGGLGINLVAANRVVIFDVSWNPSHDVQSIFRVYRFGQKKPCYVYRFLAMGTMEEKIYERQVTKQAISKRVIDEQQIDRHYAENDLAELYKFEPHPPSPRPLPPLPKDRLFAEMLREHETQIYKYHEHDSLLENKEEETLSEEERKAAWEDFENEKNKPPPAPFPSPWIMHNGMVPNLMAQQQQQLAYAALASLLRKDMPNLNENQIRDMLPLIYNSNPGMFAGYDYGLLQKMADMYKYTQSSMMNPGMMNPVMNPGMPAGGGGTSGLQYEPPWQRQHQQQQIRLQQLLQQNQMGAKFYAGGLGSRDPVAMALQQQRAREIMLGGGGGGSGVLPPGPPLGAGRPRGRPPHVPRQSAAHSSDVVNLDSD